MENEVTVRIVYCLCSIVLLWSEFRVQYGSLIRTLNLNKSHAIAGTTARYAVNFEAGSDCNGTGAPFDEHTQAPPSDIIMIPYI